MGEDITASSKVNTDGNQYKEVAVNPKFGTSRDVMTNKDVNAPYWLEVRSLEKLNWLIV